MTRALVALAVLAVSGCCGVGRGWDHTNTAMEAAFVGELTVDALETGGIVGACQEYNPIIGRCGDRLPYGVYIPLVGLLHVAAALVLPPRWRDGFQAATLGVEGHVVYINAIVPLQPAPAATGRRL